MAKALQTASEVLYEHEVVSSALSKIDEVRAWVQDQMMNAVSFHIDRLAQELVATGAGAPSEEQVSGWTAKASTLAAQLPTAELQHLGSLVLKVPGKKDTAIELSEHFATARELLTSLVLLAKVDSKNSAFQDSIPEEEIAVVKKYVLSAPPRKLLGVSLPPSTWTTSKSGPGIARWKHSIVHCAHGMKYKIFLEQTRTLPVLHSPELPGLMQ